MLFICLNLLHIIQELSCNLNQKPVDQWVNKLTNNLNKSWRLTISEWGIEKYEDLDQFSSKSHKQLILPYTIHFKLVYLNLKFSRLKLKEENLIFKWALHLWETAPRQSYLRSRCLRHKGTRCWCTFRWSSDRCRSGRRGWRTWRAWGPRKWSAPTPGREEPCREGQT